MHAKSGKEDNRGEEKHPSKRVDEHSDKHESKKDRAQPQASLAAHAAPHWEYTGELGPQNWHSISTDFAACQAGQEQSPINLSDYTSKEEKRPVLALAYQLSPVSVLNNGHTLQVNFKGENNLKLGDTAYKLLQFHFHTPSEHQLNHVVYPLEFHFVHKSRAGGLAVLGVFAQEGPAHPDLESLLGNLPVEQNKERALGGVLFNARNFFPSSQNYFSYKGSLTTPPCGEKVAWQVMCKPITMSAEQIETFRNLYSFNARPAQPLHNRVLLR